MRTIIPMGIKTIQGNETQDFQFCTREKISLINLEATENALEMLLMTFTIGRAVLPLRQRPEAETHSNWQYPYEEIFLMEALKGAFADNIRGFIVPAGIVVRASLKNTHIYPVSVALNMHVLRNGSYDDE